MDKRVMIVKLLLVAVYIISECECDMLSLDQAMCPDYDKTVVTAVVEDVEPSDANGNRTYRMSLAVINKEGINAMKITKNGSFTMRFPPNEMPCGHTFPADLSKEYIIAGDVGSDGILSSDMCQYVRLAQDVYKVLKDLNLLYFDGKPSC